MISRPDYTSGLSDRGFAIGLYLEHLVEASALYEQSRDALLYDPELAWSDLVESEERFEAHIDALVLGGDLALAVCEQQVTEGDAGELHAAVCVVCRHERSDLFAQVTEDLDADDEERVRALRDALAVELPEAWEGKIVAWLAEEEPWQRRVAAYVIGYRRIDAGAAIQNVLPEADLEVLPAAIWGLGRLRSDASRAVLFNTYLQYVDEDVRRESALALLRLGEPAVLEYLRAQEAPWASSLLALGGSHGDALERSAAASALEPIGALGVLGAGAVLPSLLEYLEIPQLAEAAALGLALVTGFAPREEAFVPEVFDEDELFEDELEAYRRGEMPLRPDGEPYGETVGRLSQDPEVWRTWWTEHQGRFDPGTRYRLGVPFTPMSLVRTLEAEWVPRQVRRYAYEELVIRYHIDAPFESDMPVVKQLRAIEHLERQAKEREGMFRPGRWYFAGQMLPT